MNELSNPEFWVGVAFCLVIVVFVRPVIKKARAWGKGQAEIIRNELSHAHLLRVEAEKLYEKYEAKAKNFDKEKESILEEGEKEVVALQQESDIQLQKKIEQKKKDVQARVEMLHENMSKDLTDMMMKQVMEKTKSVISQKNVRQKTEDMDKALNDVLTIFEKTVKK